MFYFYQFILGEEKGFGKTLKFGKDTSFLSKALLREGDKSDSFDKWDQQDPKKGMTKSHFPDPGHSASRARRRTELEQNRDSKSSLIKKDDTFSTFTSKSKASESPPRTKSSLVSLDDADFLKDAKSPRSPLLRSNESSPRSSKSPQGRLSPLSPDSSMAMDFRKKSDISSKKPGSTTKSVSPLTSPKTQPRKNKSPLSFDKSKTEDFSQKPDQKSAKFGDSGDSFGDVQKSREGKTPRDSNEGFSWVSTLTESKAKITSKIEEESRPRKKSTDKFLDDLFGAKGKEEGKKFKQFFFVRITSKLKTIFNFCQSVNFHF